MSVTPYLPQSLRRLEVFQKVGKLGVERVIVGEGHVAVVINDNQCVTVFDHVTGDSAKAKPSEDRLRSDVLSRGHKRSSRRSQGQEVLIASEPNVLVAECFFHRTEGARSPLNLVIIWQNGLVKMWDFTCGRWSPASTMTLDIHTSILSACITETNETGSLIYIEELSTACEVRIAPLTQDTRLSLTLMGAPSVRAKGTLLATLPLSPAPVVRPAPLGCVWAVSPGQVLLLPIKSEGKANSAAFSIGLRCTQSAPPLLGPAIVYSSFSHNAHTLELVFYNAETATITLLGAKQHSNQITPLIAECSNQALLTETDPTTTVTCLSSTHIALLGANNTLIVYDLTSEIWGRTTCPPLTSAAQRTKGYPGIAILYSKEGIYQVRPEAVVGGADTHTPSAVDWEAEIHLDELNSMVPSVSVSTNTFNARHYDPSGAVQDWLHAECPADILETSEALGDHLNAIAEPLGKRGLGGHKVKRAVTETIPKGKRKVRVIIPTKGDVGEMCGAEDDVSWGTRLQLYNRIATNEGLWDAATAAEVANEELSTALKEAPLFSETAPPETEAGLFAHLLSAGATGEEEYWEPPAAPTTPHNAADTAAALLDELGLYALVEKEATTDLHPTLESASALEGEEETTISLFFGEGLPVEVTEALPNVFDGMPHVVPLIALHMAVCNSDGDDASFSPALTSVSQQLLPYLYPCSCPTKNASLVRSRGRVVSLLLYWSHDIAGSLRNAIAKGDILFAISVFQSTEIEVHIAESVLEQILQTPIQPSEGIVTEEEGNLEELREVTAEDVKTLRSLVWRRMQHVAGGEMHLLALLTAEGEEESGVIDDFALLKEALKHFAFGNASAEDVNHATEANLEALCEHDAEELLQIVVESPFLWDMETRSYTPDLDTTKGHLLYSLLTQAGHGSTQSLSISETQNTERNVGGGGTLLSSHCRDVDPPPSTTLRPSETDLHPLSIPLSDFLPLLGVSV